MTPFEESALAISQRPAALNVSKRKDIEETAREFEGMFISQMLQSAWDTVPTDGPMSGGMGETIFRSLMIQDIGKQLSLQGGIGLSSQLKAELIALQEGKSR